MVKSHYHDGILLILEHKPVFTIGSIGGWENILAPIEELKKQGIDIAETKEEAILPFTVLDKLLLILFLT